MKKLYTFIVLVTATVLNLIFSTGASATPVCDAHFNHYSSNTNADSVHFYPTTTNTTGETYLWTFGDGVTSTQIEPWHLYASAGSYYVCLTVSITNSTGSCTSTLCDSIHIETPLPPVCNAHFSHYSSNTNVDSVHFYPTITNATSYFWTFGDGTTSSQITPWHLYASAGSYYVCLTVSITNSTGSCTSTLCDSIHIETPLPPVCNAHFSHYSSNTNVDSVHFYPTITNATSYFWTFGDGTTSSQITPWHLYASAGSYYVCLTVTISNSSGNCTSTLCDSIHIETPLPPVCNAHFNHYSSSTNVDSVHFYPTITNATSYFWTFGDGSTSSQIAPWHLYATGGYYYVCLTVTISNSSGTCTSTLCDSIHIETPLPPICNAHFSHYSSNTNVDSVHFYPTITNATSYFWTFGDGTTSSQITPWHLYASAGSYYVCLTVTISNSSGNCTSTLCDSIHIETPLPPVCNAHFSHYSSNTNVDSVHFYPTITNATSYFWTFGDGSTSSQIAPWHLYATGGYYYVCLTVTISNSSGTCTSTLCDSIHIEAPLPPVCNAHFYHYSSSTNVDSVHFYPTITNATSYFWTFGDGSTSSQITPWHLYATGGYYYVCLTVTISNSSGTCTSTLCDSIHIETPLPPVCNAHFYHYLSSTNADSVHFYPTITNATSYFWTFGDGTTSSQITPWHLYASAGSYYVCLTVTISNSSGNCTSTLCDSIHIETPLPPVCNAHFYHYSSSTNADSVHFYPTITNATSYFWTFGDGSTSSQIAPWHLYATGGYYYVCLTVTISNSSGNCTSTLCDSIHIETPLPPVCNAHFYHYSSSTNVDSVHFYPTITNATSYFWTFGDGSTSSQITPWHLYASAGSYYVCLTVTISNSSGNCTSTLCDSIHIETPLPPVCNAHFYHYSSSTNVDSVHFYPTITNATSYFWTFGDGTTSSQITPWHLYATGGYYYVCLTVTISNSSGNCTSTLCDSIHIEAPLPPVCNAHFYHYSSSTNVDSVHFYPTITNATSYFWTFGDGTTSSQITPWHLYATGGYYYVCLTVTISNSSGNCTSTLCDSIHIEAPLPPVCNAHFNHYSSSTNADYIHFYPTTANTAGATYLWTFGDGTTSTQIEPWHFFGSTGTYSVCLTVTITNSAGNCISTFCDNIFAPLNPIIMINPNPMREITNVTLSNITVPVTFRIYDYTGHLLFTKENLINGSFNIGKEGMSSGIYFYQLSGNNEILSEGKLIILE